MDKNDLIKHYPVLFHMAELGSWPNIQKYGLLSTSVLLDIYNYPYDNRASLESNHRPENVVISDSDKADVIIRDQKPMDDKGLIRCLQNGLTPKDWYEILNRKSFFWTSKVRLYKLLCAQPYRDKEHDVLIIDTRGLVDRYEDNIFLSRINTGATKQKPAPRGLETFLTIKDCDFGLWRKNRPLYDTVVEVCVEDGVPDIIDFVLTVNRMKGKNIIEKIA